MPLLEIDRLTVRFGGVTALNDVSFRVDQGEFVSIIGPNGAGKTTLFNVIAGVLPASGGEVRFKHRSLHQVKPAYMSHYGVRRTFQVARPFKTMTVRDNVLASAATKRVLHSARVMRPFRRDKGVAGEVDALLTLTGLTELASRRASELNMGGLRRLEIARALAGKPDVLLLDEPAAGIGADGMRSLAALIRTVSERGLTVLLVEHYVGLALSLADRVVVLDEGRLIANGTPAEIRNDERVISAYLGRSGSESVTRNAAAAQEE